MRRTLLSAPVVFVLASPALANQCPALWQQVNVKMHGAQLSEADHAKLTELRQQADTLHHAGKHADAETALNAALALFTS
jgi:hypothetical protein